MYIAARRGSDTSALPRPANALRATASNVVALGLVSLVTDISSEMVTAVWPLYLVLGLGLTPLQFGAIDGFSSVATVLVRLLGGHLADRWQRLKAVATFGYALSAISKLGWLLAGASPLALGAVSAADRAGKGIRTAPRDALIASSSTPETLGRSFGVHRAMDTVGAFLGPFAAMGVLKASFGSYDAVFVASFCIAVAGVLLMVTFVGDRKPPAASDEGRSLRAAIGLLRLAPFRRIVIWAALLGLVTVSDAFVYLLLQRRWSVDAVYFPMLPLGSAGVYLLLAVPLGHLSDRIGRWVVFLGGHLALMAALLALLGPTHGAVFPVMALALHGIFYAATDGVLMAAAGQWLPTNLQASGMSILQAGQAGARVVSSVLFGWIWTAWDPHAAVLVMASALGAVVLAAAIVRPLRPRGAS
ncbi:MFS transporter [Pendulispora albinea]|uniref:MFS transporter n=1 Tax=Pendulispora albinea TaxID=2741071 RepID=A0ABZ2M1Y1_9BACT